MSRSAEIAVVGGGPSGLVAALGLASAGADTVLFAPPAGPDRRTTALLDGSVRLLEALGIWPALRAHAAPLQHLRLVDATGRLIRAPEITFRAEEMGLEAFGYNIENELLRRELLAALGDLEQLEPIEQPVQRLQPVPGQIVLHSAAGEIRARLVIGADGRHSLCRAAAGIVTRRRETQQTAIVVNLRHTRSHANISTEFHTASGPFTLVPLPGDRSSLVWVLTQRDAEDILRLSDTALAREIERRAHSLLGKMQIDGPRGSFPLGIEVADRLAASRIMLVGEAGHLLPPIGAQGLNLGLRDAALAIELAVDARSRGADPGSPETMVAYDSRRRPDVESRAAAVELMNRSLLTDLVPAHAARSIGLELASRFGFVRRTMMRQGLGPADDPAPRLARRGR